MPKKKKLKLTDLSVKSFVTMPAGQKKDVKGGAERTVDCEPPTLTESCGGTCETCNTCYTCPVTACGGQCETMVTDCSCETCGCPDPSLDSCINKPWVCPY